MGDIEETFCDLSTDADLVEVQATLETHDEKHAEIVFHAKLEAKDTGDCFQRPRFGKILANGDLLSMALQQYINKKVEDEALTAIRWFYAHIVRESPIVTVQYIENDRVHFVGQGDIDNTVHQKSTKVWHDLQDPIIRGRAVELCRREGVELILDYSRKWRWEMIVRL